MKNSIDRQDEMSFIQSVYNAKGAAQSCDFAQFSSAYAMTTALGDQFAQVAEGLSSKESLEVTQLALGLEKALRENFDKKCICQRRS